MNGCRIPLRFHVLSDHPLCNELVQEKNYQIIFFWQRHTKYHFKRVLFSFLQVNVIFWNTFVWAQARKFIAIPKLPHRFCEIRNLATITPH